MSKRRSIYRRFWAQPAASGLTHISTHSYCNQYCNRYYAPFDTIDAVESHIPLQSHKLNAVHRSGHPKPKLKIVVSAVRFRPSAPPFFFACQEKTSRPDCGEMPSGASVSRMRHGKSQPTSMSATTALALPLLAALSRADIGRWFGPTDIHEGATYGREKCRDPRLRHVVPCGIRGRRLSVFLCAVLSLRVGRRLKG